MPVVLLVASPSRYKLLSLVDAERVRLYPERQLVATVILSALIAVPVPALETLMVCEPEVERPML